MIQSDFIELGEAVAAGTALPVSHTIAGNRMRMAGSVRLMECNPTASLLACRFVALYSARSAGSIVTRVVRPASRKK